MFGVLALRSVCPSRNQLRSHRLREHQAKDAVPSVVDERRLERALRDGTGDPLAFFALCFDRRHVIGVGDDALCAFEFPASQ